VTLSRTALPLCLTLLFLGCAHVEPPPGGPDDTTPPEVLVTQPEAGSIVPGFSEPVVLQFAERISERSVDDAVTVSPRTSPVEVDPGRDQIRVSLRRGWEPGVIYHIGVSGAVQDLFNNRLAEPIRLVFSTGPEIPETSLSGTVIDRTTGRPEPDLRVEAIRSDSLVYAATTDSVGGFEITQFPEGEYQVRAFRDLNRNRALDLFEARDSASADIRIGQDVEVALRVVDPDSTGPIAGGASISAGIVQVEFDDFLDPDQPLDPSQVTIADSTGATVPVDTVAIGEIIPAIPDSLQTAPPDSAPPAAPPPPAGGLPAPGAGPPQPGAPSEGLPARELAIGLAEGVELAPGVVYTVTIEGIRNIVGLVGGGESTFTAPDQPTEPAAAPAGAPGPGG
jgi:hypothetical protein